MRESTGFDLLGVVQRDVPLRRESGDEYHGPCPLCGGVDRFWVKGDRWFCRRCTPRGGDAIQYIRERDRVGFVEAKATLEGTPLQPAPPAPPRLTAPDAAWREQAAALCAAWQALLWSPSGKRALAWLRGRGLADATIQAGGLGFCAADGPAGGWYQWHGITIPVHGVDGVLYGVRIRRPVPLDARGQAKYVSLKGSRNALYGVLRARRVLLVVEGFFDCLLAAQHLGEVVDVATMNLTRPDGLWLNHLMGYARILVCLDSDEAGEKGWDRWSWIGTARRVTLPAGKDITQFVVGHGGDLRAWLDEALLTAQSPPPGEHQPVLPSGSRVNAVSGRTYDPTDASTLRGVR